MYQLIWMHEIVIINVSMFHHPLCSRIFSTKSDCAVANRHGGKTMVCTHTYLIDPVDLFCHFHPFIYFILFKYYCCRIIFWLYSIKGPVDGQLTLSTRVWRRRGSVSVAVLLLIVLLLFISACLTSSSFWTWLTRRVTQSCSLSVTTSKLDSGAAGHSRLGWKVSVETAHTGCVQFSEGWGRGVTRLPPCEPTDRVWQRDRDGLSHSWTGW